MQRNNSQRKRAASHSQKKDCYEAGHISKLIQKGLPKTVGFFIDREFKTKEHYLSFAENLMWLLKIKHPDKYSELRFTKNDNLQYFVFKLLETYYDEIDLVHKYTEFTDLVLTYNIEEKTLYENQYIISDIVPFTLDLQFFNKIKNPNMKKLVALFLKVYNSFSYTRLLDQPGRYNNNYFDDLYETESESINENIHYYSDLKDDESNASMIEELQERLLEMNAELSTLQFETDQFRNKIDREYQNTSIEDLKAFKFKKKTNNAFKDKIFELIELDLKDCFDKIYYIGDSVGRVFENCFLLTLYYEDSPFKELNNAFIKQEVDGINSDSIDPLFFQRRVQIGNKQLVYGDDSIIERIPKAIKTLEQIFEMLRNDYYI